MKEFRRIEPRIAHDDDVTLTRPEGGHPLFARSVNISASGIYVHTCEPCDIGSILFCTVLLPGGPRKLLSRVMRLETLSDAIGVALAFINLRPRDITALRAFVAQRQLRAVDARVHLAGMAAAVRCQATLAGDTVRLSTGLPFLRLDSEVGVLIEPGDGEPRNGILRRITMEPSSSDGVPHLALDVDLAQAPAGVEPPSDAKPSPTRPAVLRLVPRRVSSPLALPTVLISQAVAHGRRARAARPADSRSLRHDTAQVSRRNRFADWTSPPRVTTPQALRSPRSTLRLPDTLLIAAAALAGFAIAFVLC